MSVVACWEEEAMGLGLLGIGLQDLASWSCLSTSNHHSVLDIQHTT
jgi:hypothetical protein